MITRKEMSDFNLKFDWSKASDEQKKWVDSVIKESLNFTRECLRDFEVKEEPSND